MAAPETPSHVIDNYAVKRCWTLPLSSDELADVRLHIDAVFMAVHGALAERGERELGSVYCLAAFGGLQRAARDASLTYALLSEGIETIVMLVSELFLYRVRRLSADLLIASEDGWPIRMLEDEIRSLGELTLIVLLRPSDARSQYEFLNSEILRIEMGDAPERELARVSKKLTWPRSC